MNPTPMQFQYRLTFSDFCAAQTLHSKRSEIPYLSYVISRYLFPVIGACVLAFSLTHPSKTGHPDYWGYLCAAYLLSCPLLIWVSRKRCYKAQQMNGGECKIAFNEDQIRAEGQYAKSEMDWRAIKSFSEDEKSFLLYVAPKRFIVIPKRVCSSDEIGRLRSLFQTQIVPVAT